MRHRVLLVMFALALGTMASVAEAAVGEVRFNISVPFDAQCSENTGTALALVPGGKAGFPRSPILLVTSCVNFGEGGSEIDLFFSDPSGGEGAEVVKTPPLATIFPSTATAASKPTNGWEALVLRADKGDLLGCGTNGSSTVLWSIDFSPFNTTPDGSATFLRNGPAGSSCGSIAWDPSDSTVYQTPASGLSIFHFKNDGTALPPIVVPSTGEGAICTTAITGLGIAGTSLFVACSPGASGPTVAQLYKVDGSLVRSFSWSSCSECGPTPLTSLHGVPDDPTTLASEFNELLWTLDTSGQFWAFEMAGGTLGQKTGPPVLAPGSCPGGNVSSDGDGLLDCWKNGALWSDGKPGINYAGIYGTVALPATNTTRDVTLCVTNPPAAFNQDTDCAKPGRKDLFLEVDYMDFHKPDTSTGSAVDLVVQMFKNAPLTNVDLPNGVSLHVQVDDLVTVNGQKHFTNVAFVPCTPPATDTTTTVDFDTVKKLFFGTAAERASLAANANALNAKALVFRYALMAHNLLGLGTTSGCAEILGNDLVVSLGSWGSKTFTVTSGRKTTSTSHNVGTLDQLSGTIGHEFGHTLGLRHGGGDNINCKPNYPSIMNYTLQFSPPTGRVLDYSGQELLLLDKTNLNENQGVGLGLFTGSVAFGPVAPLHQPSVASAVGAIDWNLDGEATDTGVIQDLSQTTNATGGCPANQKGAPDNELGQFLVGFNDWANIQFNFRASVDFADGGHITSGETQPDPPANASPEITLETAAALCCNATAITVDLKPDGPNNNVNRNSNQDIEVAIFGATGLDATTISPGTVLLQGLPQDASWTVHARQKNNGEFFCDVKDVNHDGLQDLECKFKIPANTVGAGETEVLITAATFNGLPVFGTAPITVHP